MTFPFKHTCQGKEKNKGKDKGRIFEKVMKNLYLCIGKIKDGKMNKKDDFWDAVSQLILRFTLSATMLSAVADRLGLWEKEVSQWGSWSAFEKYTQTLLGFIPEKMATAGAYVATALEIALSFALVVGYKVRQSAFATAVLLSSFAIAMWITLGIKTTFDYSVWVGACAGFYLSCREKYQYTID